MEMSGARVRWRCDVMDSAYDAKAIREHSAKLGHEDLIKPNKGHHKQTLLTANCPPMTSNASKSARSSSNSTHG